MSTIKEYLDYAELAQVSYGDLVAGMFGKNNVQYINELTRKDNDGEIEFSTTQASIFANRYEVLATSTEYSIGDISSFLVVNSVIDNMIIYGTNIGDILNGDQIDIGSNDTIYGLGGGDTICGLDGNDTIDGGIGNDHLDGGSGIDTISYESENNPVTVDLATSIQYNYYSGIDYISNFENIKGSNYDDMLVGDNSNNVLSGLMGNDLIMAGNGDDTLIGGEGEDLLWGEAGNDNFILSISGNGDTILDFSHGEDHIYLNKTIFTSLTENGVLNSDFFVANDTGKATDGNDYIAYNIYTGELFYDVDGNGQTAAVKIATMHGLSSYTDFVVI